MKLKLIKINSCTDRIARNKLEVIALSLSFIALVALFIHKLDYTALWSYDEAWYGSITKNLIASKNPFQLMFDGRVFTDHPPLGFMMMAVPMAVFGASEFSVRLTSVLTGAASVILVYLIGRKLAGRRVGLSAGVILLSSMWFVFRTRSGNLDIPFLFWEILTVYFLLFKSKKSLYLATLSFAGLILTKTLVGFGLLPVFLLLTAFKLQKKEISKLDLLKILGVWLVCVTPWYVVNQHQNQDFLRHHFLDIGARSSRNDLQMDALKSSLNYLAIGIGKWFKIFWVAVLAGITNFVINKKQRLNFAILAFWFGGFSIFLLSSETEIWHLIPLYPVVSLIIPLSLETLIKRLAPKLKNQLSTAMLATILVLAIYQFRQFSNLFYLPEPQQSDEKDISIKSGKYDQIHLLGTFYPASVYYSDKTVDYLFLNPDSYQAMVGKMASDSKDVFIINKDTENQLLKDAIGFKILEKNSSYSLITGE